MKNIRNQSGFAMLEVVLAIVIIAIASFGVYKLYKSSSVNGNLSNEENLVSQIYNAANQLASVNGSQPTAKELFDSGAFSTDVYPANDGIFPAAFGDAKYVGNSTYSTIEVDKIPGSVAKQLAAHMQDWGDVYIGSSAGTAYTSSTSFDSGSEYTITLAFPRGLKEESGSLISNTLKNGGKFGMPAISEQE